ncbi:MAG: ABC transporter ATP-binding protein, partial [Planctomycetota bacterium]
TDLRRDLFRHIQRLPRSYLDRVRTGDLMSRATADLDVARMAIGPGVMYLTDSLLRTPVLLALMFAVNAELAVYAVLPLLAIAVSILILAPRLHGAARMVQDQLADITARSQESFSGARVIKTFATEGREQAAMEGVSRDYVRANLRLARVRGLVWAVLGFLGVGGFALLLYVAGGQSLAGRLTLGDLLLFYTYQTMLTWPMMAVGWVLTLFQRGRAGLERIGEVFAQPVEASAEGEVPPARGEIELRRLRFAYDGAGVLDDVSLQIPPGSTLGVLGPTGSGKSTLVSLLPRLYDPPPGTLFVDGRDVLDWPLPALRGAIAFVPQEAFLFSRSIGRNIAFGRPGADDETLQRAAQGAHLVRDLDQLPSGLDTVVGERGVTLSGGQKQRVALARAIAADAPILILDDALSAVDTETEAAILRNLERIRRGRTVVVVAHRVSAVRDADRIIVLDRGRIAETGSDAELRAAGGLYARMARTQELEEEIEATDE